MSNIMMSIKALLNKMLYNQKGASDSILITFTGLGIAAVLMFMFPLMSMSERNDDIAQSVAQTATSELVDKIAVAGAIKPSDYEEYEQKLAATGNTYDIEIEVQVLDENPGKKGNATSPDLIGENVRYSVFTTEILNHMYNEDGTSQNYVLKKGDNVIVKFKNTNTTMAGTFRTFFYKVAGKGTPSVEGSASSMVIN